MGVYRFSYPSTVDVEELMIRDLLDLMHADGICETDRRCFLQSVSEAFTNAVIHGNDSDPTKSVIVRVRVNRSRLLADIIDQGRGGLGKVLCRRPSQLLDENGRGLDLIKYYATRVDFTETPEGGLKVSIRLDRERTTKTVMAT